MSIESFYKCHDRIHYRIKRKYNISYALPIRDTEVFLYALISYSPQCGNATKVLKLLVHMAKKHKVNITLEACSRAIRYPSYYRFTWDTSRELEYYYWRALLMYQRAGFRPVNKTDFIRGIKKLLPVDLRIG